jgi:hypothetical protein
LALAFVLALALASARVLARTLALALAVARALALARVLARALAVASALALALPIALEAASSDAVTVGGAAGRGATARVVTVGVVVVVTRATGGESPALSWSLPRRTVSPRINSASQSAGRPILISWRLGVSHSGGQAHSMGNGHSQAMTSPRRTRTIQM